MEKAKERQAYPMCWKSLSFIKHNHSEKKEGNVCSDWKCRDFQLNRATESGFSKSKGYQYVHTIGKNCRQFNHQIGIYAIRSMTNSVPAGLSSQLQCYPYNTDKAVTADHNTCEQELMIDNKAMQRPRGKCRMFIGDPQKARASTA